MPPEGDAPLPALEQPAAMRPAHTGDPDALDDATPPRGSDRGRPRRPRRGIEWRHVLVAGVVGAIVGALLPGGIQLAERAAVGADEDRLRATAMEYLTAIVEGRAVDAEAMIGGSRGSRAVSDAVLQSAEGITDPGVRLVHIDGDEATVEVSYAVGGEDVVRPLSAERAAGTWQLTDSLVEGVAVYANGGGLEPRIAGIAVPSSATMQLHPGVYAFDEVEDPLLEARGEAFAVDGDPSTRGEVHFEAMPAEGLLDRASSIAVAVAERCRADNTCAEVPDGDIRSAGAPFLAAVAPQFLELRAQVVVGGEHSGIWFDLGIRIPRDDDGVASEWLCTPIGGFEPPTEPCPAV